MVSPVNADWAPKWSLVWRIPLGVAMFIAAMIFLAVDDIWTLLKRLCRRG